MKMNTCEINPKYSTFHESQLRYQSYTCDNILELADLLLVKQEHLILSEHLSPPLPLFYVGFSLLNRKFPLQCLVDHGLSIRPFSFRHIIISPSWS